ncbi:MAG: hypothetical protein ACQEXG_09580 [Pseudomonadota bacterium]
MKLLASLADCLTVVWHHGGSCAAYPVVDLPAALELEFFPIVK